MVNLFIPKKILKRQGEELPQNPKEPIIKNPVITNAQKHLNKLLKREDITTNANPNNEEEYLVILLHGYGSSKWLWLDPYFGTFGWLRDYSKDPKPRNYGWHSSKPPSHMYTAFDISISPLKRYEGLFPTLMKNNFEVLTYTQKDAFGDIDVSSKELEFILEGIEKVYGERKLILIGHSRGGLIIRRYMDLINNSNIEKVITIGTLKLYQR